MKSEQDLLQALETIRLARIDAEYKVSRMEGNIETARKTIQDNQAAIRKERAQIKSLTTEFAKVEAARDALKAAKPATQTRKKTALKKKK